MNRGGKVYVWRGHFWHERQQRGLMVITDNVSEDLSVVLDSHYSNTAQERAKYHLVFIYFIDWRFSLHQKKKLLPLFRSGFWLERDSSVVKRTWVQFPAPPDSSILFVCNSSSKRCNNLFWPFSTMYACGAYTFMHIFKIKMNNFKIKSKSGCFI